VLTIEKADDAVIVEGVAPRCEDREFPDRAVRFYAAKYPPYRLDPERRADLRG